MKHSIYDLVKLFEADAFSDEPDDDVDVDVDVDQAETDAGFGDEDGENDVAAAGSPEESEEVEVGDTPANPVRATLDSLAELMGRTGELTPREFIDAVLKAERDVASAESWAASHPIELGLSWGTRQQLIEIELPNLRQLLNSCSTATGAALATAVDDVRRRALSIAVMLQQQ